MSWLGWVINVGPDYHKPLVMMEDELYLDMGGRRAKLTKFWMQLALASVIAAGGVISNSTPAVIGAINDRPARDADLRVGARSPHRRAPRAPAARCCF